MKRQSLVMLAALMALSTALGDTAEAAKRGKRGNSPEQAIRTLVADYQAAFNRGDADALAAFWAPEGEHVGPRGEVIQGREAIGQQYRRLFAQHPGAKLSSSILRLRIVRPDLAVLDVAPVMDPPLHEDPTDTRATIVLTKRGKQWLVESAHDIQTVWPSHYKHLKSLEWLVGSWVDEAPEGVHASVRAECGWTVRKNFLVRRFTAEIGGEDAMAGTQVIGWDPKKQQIQSWVFESNGNTARGVWRRDGERWIIKVTGTLGDGRDVASTNIVTPIDADTFTFASTERTVAGEPQSDIPPITIRRVGAAEPLKPEDLTPGSVLPELP